MKILALALALALCASTALAGSTITGNVTQTTGQKIPIAPMTCVNLAGVYTGCGGTTTVSVAPLTTTQTNGTVTTHLTFQTALASNASRNGCVIQNRSTDTELVFFGANVSATSAKSFALGPASVTGGAGGAISCSVGGLGVATDNIAITSLANDGATYTVSSQ